MDMMKSSVSLSTGITYDQSSIQTWLNNGHNTCPATIQVLPFTDFVPNLTSAASSISGLTSGGDRREGGRQ
ncbi:hypothetical protein ACSBR2_001811 [Camellia fascicularis]